MLESLAPELVISILQHLRLESLARLELLSHTWKAFTETHESTIYRNAAIQHGYIQLDGSQNYEEIYSQRSLREVDSWRTLCRSRVLVDKAWSAKAPSLVREIPASGKFVHRFKVDEGRGIMIRTTARGGVSVFDLDDIDAVGWSLNSEAVVEYAHCEYSNGFIVFNRMLQGKEVWRLASDYDNGTQFCPESHPDEEMLMNYRAAKEKYGTTLKGHFKPWALITAPNATRAFRFVYPTLVAASASQAYVWNIRTGALTSSTSLSTAFRGLNAVDEMLPGRINYVEISDRHIFTCCTRALRVYQRDTPEEDSRLVMQIPSTQWSYGQRRYKVDVTEGSWGDPTSQLIPHRLVPRYGPETYNTWSTSTRLLDMFVAAHVSECGRHLVALLHSSRVMIIYDFEGTLRQRNSGERFADPYHAAIEIQVGSLTNHGRYLCYENGRVGVATTDGVFVIDIRDPSRLKAYHLRPFLDTNLLSWTSCLQMTDTGLYINYDFNEIGLGLDGETIDQRLAREPELRRLDTGDAWIASAPHDHDFEPIASTVCMVDFAPVQKRPIWEYNHCLTDAYHFVVNPEADLEAVGGTESHGWPAL